MFNKKEKKRIAELEGELEIKTTWARELLKQIENLHKDDERQMAALMRQSLGIEIDFSDIGPDGKPPHYLSGLSEDEHRQFIIDAQSVYDNKAYQTVVKYMINIFGFHTLYKEEKDQMKNGQVATVAFGAFRKQFDDMHKEFLLLNQKKEEFDPLDPLPE